MPGPSRAPVGGLTPPGSRDAAGAAAQRRAGGATPPVAPGGSERPADARDAAVCRERADPRRQVRRAAWGEPLGSDPHGPRAPGASGRCDAGRAARGPARTRRSAGAAPGRCDGRARSAAGAPPASAPAASWPSAARARRPPRRARRSAPAAGDPVDVGVHRHHRHAQREQQHAARGLGPHPGSAVRNAIASAGELGQPPRSRPYGPASRSRSTAWIRGAFWLASPPGRSASTSSAGERPARPARAGSAAHRRVGALAVAVAGVLGQDRQHQLVQRRQPPRCRRRAVGAAQRSTTTATLSAAMDAIRDTLARPLHDLRISVTDRCNFRCTYCMPREVFGARLPVPAAATELLTLRGDRAPGPALRRAGRREDPPHRRRAAAAPRPRAAGRDARARIDGLDDLTLTTNGSLLAAQSARARATPASTASPSASTRSTTTSSRR